VSTLRFYFLGTLDIRYDDQLLPKPPTLKSQSLLAYLIVHRHQPQPRDRLVGLFWSDRPEHKARSSLSTALWHIRRCLPTDCIMSDPHAVQFDPHAELWLDIDEFGSHLSQDDMEHLQAAVALYRGDFLDGFYDDWIINERYRLETLFSEALARLMVGQEARGEHGAALSTALRLLDRDPLREDAHRLAMRAYCWLGQRNAAMEQYRRCREIVQVELGAEPMAETTELYQAILEGRFAIGRARVQIPVIEPSAPAGRSPLDVIAPSSLVGREQETAFLHQCWERMAVGQGGLVLISGEAGVGKTRLVEEFANRLRWQGIRVLGGRCYEFERVLPYQPIAEALRTILPTLTSGELADLPGWAVGEVARLVPEVLEKAGLRVTPADGSDQEQARLFDGVARFLAELSSRGVLLVVLEDLHWASESTLQLAHYLARHLAGHPVLMVGTFRPEAVGQEHPLQALQQQLSREGLCQSLCLSRLSPADGEAMVVEMSGAGEAVLPLARRLYQETEGNPFFLMEIVKALFETGVVRLEGGAWRGDFARISAETLPLPTGLSETIQVRVRGLSEDAQEALRLAAILGREFDFDLLNAVWGRDKEATLRALDDLLRPRLIDEGTGAMGRDYAFTHHKIQEVVYAAMPRRRRQHAHARIGTAMERLYGIEVEAFAGELAFHFEQGQHVDKTLTEKAITYLLQAGDRARGLYAHQEAIDYYQQALALLKKRGEYERAARTLMKLGLTYHTAFDFQRVRQAYEEGFALWQRAGEMEPAGLPPAPHALRMDRFPPPRTLEPNMGGDVFSDCVITQLFSGLVELSPEMEVLPDVAQSWEVLEGGCRYVFHLRDDVRWSDGVPVTAGDFEYAWKRVLDPVAGSLWANLLYDVKGARGFHQGGASDPDNVGVRALDESTLLVELEEPTGYFLHLLANFFPVPRHVIEAHGEAWTEVGNIVTNGPFRLEAWQPDESLVLIRNPEYHGRFTGNVERVELCLLPEWSARLALYEADRLDVLSLYRLPPPEMERVRQRHPGEHILVPELGTFYIGFDVSRSPFDDLRVRRAFVLATDRAKLTDVILRGYGSPATGGFVPPGMPGHSAGIGLPYDPGQARQLLAEAGYSGGYGFPVVRALVPEANVPQSKYLRAQWRESLGVDIPWESMEWSLFCDRMDREPPHLFLAAWAADYPDPNSFLRESWFLDRTRWQNKVYNILVEKARRLTDQGERMELYRQADRILVEEAPIMPLIYSRQGLLVKPWVRKYPTSPIMIEYFFGKDVIIEPH
jgi:ABC-type oligopeptide transport system substrate-binding subunit/DNA-binding SARP family transcriptional activator